ncbi:MAG: hypothetical protein EBQ82_06585 [Betaproteobacteria bacterium]|nr:hypothetical protein [Betaproteobacteria bacterium]NBY05046.1 hypothetical protein [Betaproteobacteria bacterium]
MGHVGEFRFACLLALLSPVWLGAQTATNATEPAVANASQGATGGSDQPTSDTTPALSKGDAVFRFERENDRWILIDVNVRVFLDGKQVCVLANGGNCEVQATPGSRRIKIDQRFTTGEFSRLFNAEAGKRYTLGITRKESKAWIEAFSPFVGGAAYYFSNRTGEDSDNSDWTAKFIAQE